MKVVNLQYPLNEKECINQSIVLALGFFDGVHKGHQSVIMRAKDIAQQKGVPLAVMSFDKHPSKLFIKQSNYKYLTDLKSKMVLFEQLGVDIFYIVSFTKSFASLTPEQFETLYLEKLNVVAVVAGFDYCYGHRAQGKIADLKQKETPYDVIVVDKLTDNIEKISSTAIKDALEQGDLLKAKMYLGRYYTTRGIVIHGQKRGRELGYPTANINVSSDILLLKEGVYAVKIQVKNKWHNGMASIGRNITFEPNRPITVEVNIFDFNEMIYDEEVVVQWHYYLRDEIKFNGMAELIKQLELDEQHSRKLLTV